MVKRKIFEEKRKMSELSIQPLTKFKLVFLGEQAVGKTSLITRLNLLPIAIRFRRTLSGFQIYDDLFTITLLTEITHIYD